MTKASNPSEKPVANPKQKYQVMGWSEYNKGLVNRRGITLYCAEDAIEVGAVIFRFKKVLRSCIRTYA